MKEIVFATNNQHKLSEMRAITDGMFKVRSLSEIGCHVDIPETADNLKDNALSKALYIKEHFGYDCFADDTGLEVDCLDGAPGVHSARYAPGTSHDSEANSQFLLENMRGCSNRSARFRTVIALVRQGHENMLFEGVVEGTILNSPQGKGGFGYDPLFVPDGYSQSFAEMSAELKNSISHRGRATQKLIDYLKKNYL